MAVSCIAAASARISCAAFLASYTALRDGRSFGPLDPYGGESPGEFFAVATETFFDAPLALESGEPDLFDVLRDFYKQDPAARVRAR